MNGRRPGVLPAPSPVRQGAEWVAVGESRRDRSEAKPWSTRPAKRGTPKVFGVNRRPRLS